MIQPIMMNKSQAYYSPNFKAKVPTKTIQASGEKLMATAGLSAAALLGMVSVNRKKDQAFQDKMLNADTQTVARIFDMVNKDAFGTDPIYKVKKNKLIPYIRHYSNEMMDAIYHKAMDNLNNDPLITDKTPRGEDGVIRDINDRVRFSKKNDNMITEYDEQGRIILQAFGFGGNGRVIRECKYLADGGCIMYSSSDWGGSVYLFDNNGEQIRVKCNESTLEEDKIKLTPEFAQYLKNSEQINVEQKIDSDENLRDNKLVQENKGLIVSLAETPERAARVNRILSEENLYNNPNIMNEETLKIIINSEGTPEQMKLLDRFLSEEKFYNNSSFVMPYKSGYRSKLQQMLEKMGKPKNVKLINKFCSIDEFHNDPILFEKAFNVMMSSFAYGLQDSAMRIFSSKEYRTNMGEMRLMEHLFTNLYQYGTKEFLKERLQYLEI